LYCLPYLKLYFRDVCSIPYEKWKLIEPGIYLSLETAHLLKREVMGALYKARNSITHTDPKGNVIKGYADSTKFVGGLIILKLIDIDTLIYLNVDDLQTR
jgi:hypothetical protein